MIIGTGPKVTISVTISDKYIQIRSNTQQHELNTAVVTHKSGPSEGSPGSVHASERCP